RDRVAQVTQEQDEHEEGENRAEYHFLDEVRDGLGHEAGLAARDVERDLRILRAELLECLLDALGHAHGIRARLLVDQQAHGLGTVVARERLALAETIRYGGDVTQQDTPVGSRTA